MNAKAARGPQPSGRRLLGPAGWAWLALLGGAAALCLLAPAALAETPIANVSTSQLFVLDAAQSPYVLDHDFHVQVGGFLLVGAGVELRMDNGAALYGDGGAISVTGSAASPARVLPRPAGNASAWGGFILQNGSVLTVHHADVWGSDPGVRMYGAATVDVADARFAGCGAWCIQTVAGATLTLKDASFANGTFGLVEEGAVNPTGDNLTFRNFTTSAMRFTATSAGAAFTHITVESSAQGVEVAGLRTGTFGWLTVDTTGAAFTGGGSRDVTVHNATLESTAGAAVDVPSSVRLTLRDSRLTGATRALSLDGATADSFSNNRLLAPGGVCVWMANVSNALFRGTALVGCLRSIAFAPGSPPSTADADRSNTVDGKPWIWVAGGAGVVVGIADDPGFVLLSNVAGADLSDLRLRGAGIYLFGSTDVRVERVSVENADAGLTAVGTRGLDIRQFTARSVGVGIVVRGGGSYPAAQDVVINHTRLDGAAADGLALSDVTNLTVNWTYARAGGAGLNVSRVQGALLRHLVVEDCDVGLALKDSAGITVVDSVFARARSFGMLVNNSTGVAARNAFLDSVGAPASAPSSPGFAFSEAGGGNFWSLFTGPNANGDAFFDTPYNFSDGTGQDVRPRVARLDYQPAVMVLPAEVIEVGLPYTLDASYSFDDFLVQTVYWSVEVAGKADTGSGPLFPWAPNRTGNFTMEVTAVDSLGAVDSYAFPVLVRDRTAPRIGAVEVGTPELGGNATVRLSNATDNDEAFPAGAVVGWSLREPSGLTAFGNATALTFDVPVDLLGRYALTVTLYDASGNAASATALFDATDTAPPEVEFTFEGEPDLETPFVVDAGQSHDPAGLNNTSATWSWTDAGQAHTEAWWPAVSLNFSDRGNHTVALRLCDRVGNCANVSRTFDAEDRSAPRLTVLRVIVPGRPAAEVRPGETPTVGGLVNEDIVFEIEATDASGRVNYTWNFGDGGSAQGARVTHRFTSLGGATVTVAMEDDVGNTNTTGVLMSLEGGGVFGNLIPGGNLGALLLVLGIGAMGAVAVLVYRWRAKERKDT